jgi:D-alanine-D-alanine ligase
MTSSTTKKRVGVLRGGPSSEYAISLKTGAAVLRALQDHKHPLSQKYKAVDIFIDKKGNWHIDGVEKRPGDILKTIDIVFNGLHGEFGEDGTVQRTLDLYGVPYTGSGVLASALAMQKHVAKKVMKEKGIKTPIHLVIRLSDIIDHKKTPVAHINKRLHEKALELFRTFPQPSVVKPASLGSSVGVSIVHAIHEIEKALQEAFSASLQSGTINAEDPVVIVEEYIKGREAAVSVVHGFRGTDLYSFPTVEIIPAETSRFFDFHAKYSGKSREACPGNFSRLESERMQEIAKELHTALGLKHYSRTDFIVHPRRGVYALEINTLPGLVEESLLPKALTAVGASFADFIEHILSLAERGE